MKHAVVVFILLFPSVLSAQSGAGILERTYRVNPNVEDLNRELLELTVLVADGRGHSLTHNRTLTAEEYAMWESGGEYRGLVLMRIYDAALADLESAVAGGKAVAKESVDQRKVQSFVAYDDILKFRTANAGVDRTGRQLAQLQVSIESMEKEAAALEVQQQEYRRQLVPASLGVSEPAAPGTKASEERLKAIWELGVKGPQSQSAVPELVRTILDPGQSAAIRMSALAAVGHIGVNSATADRIVEVVRRDSGVFGGSASTSIVNGSFELPAGQSKDPRQTGVLGGVALPPGSTDLRGWITDAGIVGTQEGGARPGGKIAVELGPRDPPGCISQAMLTTAGRNYELRFFTATGRDFQFNNRLRVRVAGVAQRVTAPVGAVSVLVRVPFKAAFPITTITFCGEGTQQFGPVIDDVSVAPLD